MKLLLKRSYDPRDRKQGWLFDWRLAAAAFFVVAVLLRLAALLYLKDLAQANYEESQAGLMARHILKGEHIAFWWGFPYLGTFSIYLTALLFSFLPATTFVLRLVPLFHSAAAALFAFLLARKMFPRPWPLAALLWWAVPPAFLLRFGLTPFNYISVIAYGNIALYCAWLCLYGDKPGKKPWFFLGFFLGLALWEHLIAACYIAAIGIFVTAGILRKKVSLSSAATGIAGFIAGNSPFLLWNALNHMETITAMLSGKSTVVSHLTERVTFVLLVLLPRITGKSDILWGTHWMGFWLSTAALVLYFPALGFSIARLFHKDPQAEGSGGSRSEIKGLGLVLTLVTAAFAQVIFSEYNKSLYLMPVYSALPVAFTFFTLWLYRWKRGAGVAALAFLVMINITDISLYVLASQRAERRPIDKAIRFLKEQDISRMYGHFRVAWPFSFESQEKIIASDYYGFLSEAYYTENMTGIYMKGFIDEMHDVDIAPRVAIVTDRYLNIPAPGEMEEFLKLLGGSYRKKEIGSYTIFYGFEPQNVTLREVLPDKVRVSASINPQDAGKALDRNISSDWKARLDDIKKATFEAEFESPVALSVMGLCPDLFSSCFPASLTVEISVDGENWKKVLDVKNIISGITWYGNHPKLNNRGEVSVWLPPGTEAKKVRISTPGTKELSWWGISEIFFYERTALPRRAPAFYSEEESRQVLDAVKRLAPEAVYSTGGWNVFFSQHLPESVKTVTSLEHIDTPALKSENVVDFSRRCVFFLPLPSVAFYRTLDAEKVAYRKETLAPGDLVVTEPSLMTKMYWWYRNQLLEHDYLSRESACRLADRARSAIKEQKWKEAEEMLRASIKDYPYLITSYEMLAECYAKQGNTEEQASVQREIDKNFTPSIPVHSRFADTVELLGLDTTPQKVRPGDSIAVTYYWRCLKTAPQWYMFVHFREPADGKIILQDDHLPQDGKNPTGSWMPGEVVKETRTVAMPAGLRHDKLELHLGLWVPEEKMQAEITSSEKPFRNNTVHATDIEFNGSSK